MYKLHNKNEKMYVHIQVRGREGGKENKGKKKNRKCTTLWINYKLKYDILFTLNFIKIYSIWKFLRALIVHIIRILK